MKEYFVDTNIFLRFLLADQKKQYRLVKKLFQKAEEGKISLWTTDVVILEIVWTLKSFYKLKPKVIQHQVSSLIALENLKVKNKDLLLQALDYFATKNVDFSDAYNFLLAKNENKKILSFDSDFDKLGKREKIEKVAGYAHKARAKKISPKR